LTQSGRNKKHKNKNSRFPLGQFTRTGPLSISAWVTFTLSLIGVRYAHP
jgi:hypothetical protein